MFRKLPGVADFLEDASCNLVLIGLKFVNLSTSARVSQMASPFASSKFVLSVLKFLGILKLLSYTQNILGVLK